MIVRVLQGRVRADGIGLFREQSRRVLARTRAQDGCSFAQVARQAHSDGSEEIVFLSVWRDLEAVYDWVGCVDLKTAPVISGDRPDVLEYYDIQHYEVVDDPALSIMPVDAASFMD